MKEKILNNLSLHILPIDERDYSHSEKFGVLGAVQIPSKDFSIYDPQTYKVTWGDTLSGIALKFRLSIDKILVANPKIKNANSIKVGDTILIPAPGLIILDQMDLDFCSGYSSTEDNMTLFEEVFDPLYGFAKIKQIRGEYTSYGANLRDACQAKKLYGSLPASKAPFTHNTGAATDRDRNFLANWLNYPTGLDDIAAKYKDGSYYSVDGPYDAFDNIRMTIFQHLNERRGVLTGMFWRPEWTGAVGGVIPEANYTTPSGGAHAVNYIGQKTINGKLYLILQNSWGKNYGDNGLFYFPRSVVNLEFSSGFGAFTLSKIVSKQSLGETIGSLLQNLISLFK